MCLFVYLIKYWHKQPKLMNAESPHSVRHSEISFQQKTNMSTDLNASRNGRADAFVFVLWCRSPRQSHISAVSHGDHLACSSVGNKYCLNLFWTQEKQSPLNREILLSRKRCLVPRGSRLEQSVCNISQCSGLCNPYLLIKYPFLLLWAQTNSK